MRDFQDSAAPNVRVRRSFRRGFDTYTENACVQARVSEMLADMVHLHAPEPGFERAFEFGCGTGNLTGALQRKVSMGSLVLNDLVPDAIAFTQDICPSARFVCGDVMDIQADGQFDLIASASVVQWIPDHGRLLDHLNRMMRPGGILALSGFGSAQFSELVAIGSTAAAPGYRDAQDWRNVLPDGLQLVAMRQEKMRMTFPTARGVLRHLRQTGVNGRARTGWTRARLARFEADYEARFATESGVTLTYDPVLLVLRKRG